MLNGGTSINRKKEGVLTWYFKYKYADKILMKQFLNKLIKN